MHQVRDTCKESLTALERQPKLLINKWSPLMTKIEVGTSFYFNGDWQTPEGRYTISAIRFDPSQYDCIDERGMLYPGFDASVVDAAVANQRSER